MISLGILGATGAVGRQMLKVLEEQNLKFDRLRLFASKNSVGKKISFKNQEIAVELAEPSSFKGCDIVLGAAENDIAKLMAPYITEAGAIFIDNSSAFRLDKDVPLIIPEINPEDAKLHKGIISNPNCSTIIALMGVYSINKISPIKSMIASTYQAVSGAGYMGPIELKQQILDIEKNETIKSNVFAHQIAYNVIPCIGSDTGNLYTSEEMKMQNEGRKILHLPNLNVTCTCVRVPVVRSHSISISVFTENHVSVEQAKQAIEKAQGCKLMDNLDKQVYPMPLNVSDQDTVFVGRIREDLTAKNGLALWVAGDQIRKGAATNAVQIAKLFF